MIIRSSTVTIALSEMPGAYAVARLAPTEPLPSFAATVGFVSITRTEDELSIVCLADAVPDGVQAAIPWVGFKFEGPFDFGLTGIADSVVHPLARAEIGIVLISTFDTDYLFVKGENRQKAIDALRAAGHRLSLQASG
jgi:uncharacterized protein